MVQRKKLRSVHHKDLIHRVASGEWQPDQNAADAQQRDAMATKGYYDAFNVVKESIAKIIEGVEAANVVSSEARALVPAALRAECLVSARCSDTSSSSSSILTSTATGAWAIPHERYACISGYPWT